MAGYSKQISDETNDIYSDSDDSGARAPELQVVRGDICLFSGVDFK